MHLESKKIIIREFNLGDIFGLRRLLSSEYVATWMPGWFKCAEFVGEWLAEVIDSYYDDELDEYSSYAVSDRQSGVLIGRADYIIQDDEICVSVLINPSYIERGHLTESYKTLLEYLRDKHKDKQIEIISRAENAEENEAIEKIGLRLDKVNRVEEVKVFNHYKTQRGTPL